MPVATFRRSVAAAAMDSTTNGSATSTYFSGRGPPCGQGEARATGIWECSGAQKDSKPRSSSARASAAGRME